MNPGILDISIDVYQDVITRDSFGGEIKSPQLFINCRAKEVTNKGKEVIDANKETAVGYTTFRIRYYPGIDTAMFVTYDTQDYNIKAINKIGRNAYLDLITEKRT